jgi:xylose isomerase
LTASVSRATLAATAGVCPARGRPPHAPDPKEEIIAMAKSRKSDRFAPSPADRFTFGLWTVGNPGRDPFGEPTRPPLSPAEIVELLGEVGGVYGVNFHDNDLIPIDATEAEAAQIKRDFRKALKNTGIKVPMATTNLFTDPVFKDGAFTSNDAEVRAYAIQKTMRAMELGAEFGAKVYVFWGGREGTDSDATKDPVEAVRRNREAMNFLCKYNLDRGFGYKFALEAKPNEPRGHIYNAVTGSYLAFIQTLDHPEMVGVNPEFAHEQMAGLSFVHQVAAALEAGKLFHIDLNDQEPGRYDQDFRFGSVSYKSAFFLVKLLLDYQYDGPKHFDSHAYRTSDRKDVIEFARGSMRTYKVLEHKARQFNKDKKIQKLLEKINRDSAKVQKLTRSFSPDNAKALLDMDFDRRALAERPLPYEELDQRVFDLLMGA